MNVVMMVVEKRRWRRVAVVWSDGDVSLLRKGLLVTVVEEDAGASKPAY